MPGTKPAANEPPEKLFEDCLESIRSAGVEAASLAGAVVDGALTEIDAVEVGSSEEIDFQPDTCTPWDNKHCHKRPTVSADPNAVQSLV
ncbi:hypothetical protein AC579_4879 [Pseudocercospora musae]|uniref:Uncharacterized protein n=1 Tax=Pseudocercospora musae TaxID=113226 RepID=A0A139IKI1_9PEZI|nr:hypothetical protein AC579_4879 [Pseudocercospora musae]